MTCGHAADRPCEQRRHGVRLPTAWRKAFGFFSLLILGTGLFFVTPAMADPSALEDAVKATYLYKFTPFIQWPDSAFAGPTASFAICVVGDDALADMVGQALAGQHYGMRSMVVRKLSTPDTGCQVLYVPGNDKTAVIAAMAVAQGKPILTVTDFTPDLANAHGLVVFINDAGHVRFDIDGAAASQVGLTISSKLLSLSRSAIPRGGQ